MILSAKGKATIFLKTLKHKIISKISASEINSDSSWIYQTKICLLLFSEGITKELTHLIFILRSTRHVLLNISQNLTFHFFNRINIMLKFVHELRVNNHRDSSKIILNKFSLWDLPNY